MTDWTGRVLVGIVIWFILTCLLFISADIHAAPVKQRNFNILYLTVPTYIGPSTSEQWDRLETTIEQTPFKTIEISLDGQGGWVTYAWDFEQHLLTIERLQHKIIIMHITYGANSAHALIACAGNRLLVDPNAFLMFHHVAIILPFGGKTYNVPNGITTIFNQQMLLCQERNVLTGDDAYHVYQHERVYKTNHNEHLDTTITDDD